MNFRTFQQKFDPVRSTLSVFRALPPDPAATSQSIEEAERGLGCKLGDKYRALLTEYGGGRLGYCVLLSPYPKSTWPIVQENITAGLIPLGLVAFSPNFTGDYYVFRVVDGIAGNEVFFYDHETESATGPEYADVFEYVLARNVRD